MAPPNTKFIEICPERAFQLAYALKIPSVLIAAFKILVNELAIDYASSNPVGRPPLTWAQRRRDDYGDYPSDPIEYASRAFAERMGAQLKLLGSDAVFDRLPSAIPEWEKLKYYRTLLCNLPSDNPVVAAHNELVAALLAAFRRWIESALDLERFCDRDGINRESLLDAQRAHYIPRGELKPIPSLYIALSPAQKVLTPFFWDHLYWSSSRTDFCATMHDSKPLSWHATVFNRAFAAGVADGSVPRPNRHHPALGNTFFGANDTALEFEAPVLYHGLYYALGQLCTRVLGNDTRGGGGEEPGVPFFLSDHHLLALDEESELKYLPIWATGLDDGTGGVFQEAVPEAVEGLAPGGPGPGFHTGFTAAGTDAEGTVRGAPTTAPSDFGVGVLSLGGSFSEIGTVGGRSLVARGTSATATATGGVGGAAPSVAMTDDEEGMYAAARYAVPASHQPQGQAIEQYVEEMEEAFTGGRVMLLATLEEDDEDAGMLYDSDEEMGFGGASDDGFSMEEEEDGGGLDADEVV